MKRLAGRKKYLGTFLDCHAPLKGGQYLSQGPPGEADSNISNFRLCSAHGQANNPAFHKAEVKVTNKTR